MADPIASAADFRAAAQRRLPRFLFDYIDGGSYAEVTLRRNVADLAGVALRQRVLRDVSSIDMSTTLFGRQSALPVVLGPVGLAGLTARRGEVQAARAASTAGVPFCLSTVSACSIGEVAAGSGTAFWFQLYILRDRGFVREMIAKAQDAGCAVLVFTVDLPTPGARYRDIRSGLAGAATWQGELRRLAQIARRPGWAWDVGVRGRPIALGNVAPLLGGKSGLEDFLGWLAGNFDPGATWDDIAWVRSLWAGPLVIKGVLDPEDARLAADAGADGIIVSNHGGRQLDGVVSAVEALPKIRDTLGDRVSILADGGVRSGLDVLRMLALGADGALLGRAWVYALAAGGEQGVRRCLEIIAAELKAGMALTGCATLSAVTNEVLALRSTR